MCILHLQCTSNHSSPEISQAYKLDWPTVVINFHQRACSANFPQAYFCPHVPLFAGVQQLRSVATGPQIQ